jgi:hypothetical protein
MVQEIRIHKMSEQIPFNGRAQKTKTSFRLLYSAGINIKAKPARVWALMTNAGDFPRWNSTVKSIEGTIASGGKIQLVATISPKRVFKLNIVEFVPKKRWYGVTEMRCLRECALLH